MSRVVYLNGEFLNENEAKVSIFGLRLFFSYEVFI